MTESKDAHEVFGQEATTYGKQYTSSNLSEMYPEHQIRLDIFLNLLKESGAKRVLDAGCGSGDPLVAMLKNGFDARGFDFSEAMVATAKANLERNGLDSGRVTRNNLEQIQGIEPGQFDAIVGLGSLYYSKVFDSTISQLAALLPRGGSLIFSLRNELFSLFSLNKYSAEFFWQRLLPAAQVPDELADRVTGFLAERFASPAVRPAFKTVDDKGIFSLFHNPLTVAAEVLAPHGLSLRGLYYYHFHALPPVFEHSDTEAFRRLSLAMETATDWRGMFMASAFIVDAVRN